MSTQGLVAPAPRRRPRSAGFVPREHGFWVMLGAALVAGLVRSQLKPPAILVALLVLIGAVALGGLLRRTVRRHGVVQIASAAGLALAGVPVELAAARAPREVAFAALVWALTFVSGALSVRAAMARARSRGEREARLLSLLSIALPMTGVMLFAWLERGGIYAAASAVAAAGALALATLAPSVKRMKAIGLSLAAVSLLAAIALSLPH